MNEIKELILNNSIIFIVIAIISLLSLIGFLFHNYIHQDFKVHKPKVQENTLKNGLVDNNAQINTSIQNNQQNKTLIDQINNPINMEENK